MYLSIGWTDDKYKVYMKNVTRWNVKIVVIQALVEVCMCANSHVNRKEVCLMVNVLCCGTSLIKKLGG